MSHQSFYSAVQSFEADKIKDSVAPFLKCAQQNNLLAMFYLEAILTRFDKRLDQTQITQIKEALAKYPDFKSLNVAVCGTSWVEVSLKVRKAKHLDTYFAQTSQDECIHFYYHQGLHYLSKKKKSSVLDTVKGLASMQTAAKRAHLGARDYIMKTAIPNKQLDVKTFKPFETFYYSDACTQQFFTDDLALGCYRLARHINLHLANANYKQLVGGLHIMSLTLGFSEVCGFFGQEYFQNSAQMEEPTCADACFRFGHYLNDPYSRILKIGSYKYLMPSLDEVVELVTATLEQAKRGFAIKCNIFSNTNTPDEITQQTFAVLSQLVRYGEGVFTWMDNPKVAEWINFSWQHYENEDAGYCILIKSRYKPLLDIPGQVALAATLYNKFGPEYIPYYLELFVPNRPATIPNLESMLPLIDEYGQAHNGLVNLIQKPYPAIRNFVAFAASVYLNLLNLYEETPTHEPKVTRSQFRLMLGIGDKLNIEYCKKCIGVCYLNGSFGYNKDLKKAGDYLSPLKDNPRYSSHVLQYYMQTYAPSSVIITYGLKMCDKNPEAHLFLGDYYYHGGVDLAPNMQKALDHYSQCMDSPVAKTSTALIFLMRYEYDPTEDNLITQAITLMKQALEMNHDDALYYMGLYHLTGQFGIEINLELAKDYMHRAAKQGHCFAKIKDICFKHGWQGQKTMTFTSGLYDELYKTMEPELDQMSDVMFMYAALKFSQLEYKCAFEYLEKAYLKHSSEALAMLLTLRYLQTKDLLDESLAPFLSKLSGLSFDKLYHHANQTQFSHLKELVQAIKITEDYLGRQYEIPGGILFFIG